MSKTYPVGIVGEANYQSAIRRCSAGQSVQILHEPDNPYDSEALAVATEEGSTLGYIARDCWVQDCIHEEGRGCEASIKEISTASNGQLGVVLDVKTSGRAIETRSYRRAVGGSGSVPKGWLARVLGI